MIETKKTKKQMSGKLVKIKINLKKLDKSRFYVGEQGTYCDLDVWINQEKDSYGYDASVNQTQSKEERVSKVPKIYVGNGWKNYGWDNNKQQRPTGEQVAADIDDGDEIPF